MIGETDLGQTREAWWLQKIHALVTSGGGSAFYGQVTTATSTTKFKVDSLKGLGTDLLNDAYYCQVIQADAAAPEGEIQKVSAYDTSDGDITVGTAFTVAPEVGDYVLILHETQAFGALNCETTGSYNLPNDTVENTLLEITNTKRLRLDSVWLDFVNLVQDVTIKVYHKIDGTTYRQYDVFSWGTSEEDGVLLSLVVINGDWKVTVTSDTAQGSVLAIPYNVIKTTMEA